MYGQKISLNKIHLKKKIHISQALLIVENIWNTILLFLIFLDTKTRNRKKLPISENILNYKKKNLPKHTLVSWYEKLSKK